MIASKIANALCRASGEETAEVTFSDRAEHGDFTSNIALKVASGKNPRAFAEELLTKLKADSSLEGWISEITIAGPGFINFFLAENVLAREISVALDDPHGYGHGKFLANRNIIVEFTDPNPFKEFHIGHLYSNMVGESICRLLESQGATVKRACYQGDVGLHVAKAIWGMQRLMENRELTVAELEKLPLTERVKFMGEAYALGATSFEEQPADADQIKSINKQVFEKDPAIMDLYKTGKTWSLQYFDDLYGRVGTKFDFFFFESEVSEQGVQVVRDHIADGIFEESQGAIVFPGEKYGLHTRVFINNLGLPTYEAKELGLAPTKHELFAYDQSIIITGNEINEYFKVLLKALSLIRPDLAEKTKHIGHGMVKLPDGKMSSRTGKIVTGESLLDNAHAAAKSIPGANADEETSEMIGQAAIKYAFLKSGIGGDIEFDLQKSLSFTGNSGPYLQYTSVRIKSLLYKSNHTKTDQGVEFDGQEQLVVRMLTRFPEVVRIAASEFRPSYVAEYLFVLAQHYNSFYDTEKIIGGEREAVRLAVSKAVLIALEQGLKLLGISVPEKM